MAAFNCSFLQDVSCLLAGDACDKSNKNNNFSLAMVACAGAPERALVPMAIPTRGLLQDDSSSGYADMEDLVSLPDVVLPVDVKVYSLHS